MAEGADPGATFRTPYCNDLACRRVIAKASCNIMAKSTILYISGNEKDTKQY